MKKISIRMVIFTLAISLLVTFIVIFSKIKSEQENDDGNEMFEKCSIEDVKAVNMEAIVYDEGIHIKWEAPISECFYTIDYWTLIWKNEFMITTEGGNEEVVHNVASINLPRSDTEYFITHICIDEDKDDYPICMRPLKGDVVYEISLGVLAGNVMDIRGEAIDVLFDTEKK